MKRSMDSLILFLMHRVELKDFPHVLFSVSPIRVPNAPCGVESVAGLQTVLTFQDVPNAPCGVESLKLAKSWRSSWVVPNAPCGVERAGQITAQVIRQVSSS